MIREAANGSGGGGREDLNLEVAGSDEMEMRKGSRVVRGA
jgi:hypothetical protein